MTKDRIKQIELTAADVLVDTFGQLQNAELPIDLGKIMDKYGLKLQFAEFKDDKVSGIYSKTEKAIFIAKSKVSPRKAFTIAHELGHYFLHAEKKQETFYRTDGLVLDWAESSVESEANVFAASLLMPEKLVRSYWNTFRRIDAITKAFHVTYSAAYYRLLNLGLIRSNV